MLYQLDIFIQNENCDGLGIKTMYVLKGYGCKKKLQVLISDDV